MTRRAGPRCRRSWPAEAVFGEGLTILGDQIFQLTWKDKLLLEYEIDTFEPHAREIAIDGWG